MADVPEAPDYLTELESCVVRLHDVEGMKWAEIGHELNMDRRNAQHAYQRAHSKMDIEGPVLSREQRNEIADKLLSTKIEKAVCKALRRILSDPAPLDRARIKELVLVCGQMIDRRQLLQGEPTQIIKIQDTRNLDKELVLLLREMERCGVMIDVWHGDLNDVTPEPIADVPVESADAGGADGAG